MESSSGTAQFVKTAGARSVGLLWSSDCAYLRLFRLQPIDDIQVRSVRTG